MNTVDEKFTEPNRNIERDIVINGVRIHIKSVFANKIPLEKVIGDIAVRKFKEYSRNNKI